MVASLLLNIVLVWRESTMPQTALHKPTSPMPPAGTIPPVVDKTAQRTKAFDWSQVESDDFPAYIANLRKIGCPEITIQRLVGAELEAIYGDTEPSKSGGPFSTRISPSTSHSTTVLSSKESAAVKSEKLSVMHSLFDSHAGVSATGSTASTSGSASKAGGLAGLQTSSGIGAAQSPPASVGNLAKPVTLPMVLRDTLGTAPVLSADELNQAAAIRDQFVNDIGGPNQDPADPAYRSRWNRAQSLADDILRAKIGWEAFNKLQMIAAQEDFARAHGQSGQ